MFFKSACSCFPICLGVKFPPSTGCLIHLNVTVTMSRMHVLWSCRGKHQRDPKVFNLKQTSRISRRDSARWPGKGPQSGAGVRAWGAGPSSRALGPVGGPLPRGWSRGVRRAGLESVGLRDDVGLHMCLGSDFRASRRRTAAILATDLRMLSSQA